MTSVMGNRLRKSSVNVSIDLQLVGAGFHKALRPGEG